MRHINERGIEIGKCFEGISLKPYLCPANVWVVGYGATVGSDGRPIDPDMEAISEDETKSLIAKLGIRVVPLASDGLLRFEDVELGERIVVAGYPYGDIFSNTIKFTGGMVSAVMAGQ